MADNATLVRSLFDAWNNRDFDAVARDVDANCTIVDMGSGRTVQGPDGFVAFNTALFEAMPDAQFTLDHLTAQGETVVVEYTGRGTHTGDLVLPAGTVPATGRSITVHVCEIDEIRNDKITSARVYVDSGAVMAQLGITERVGLTL
ncbi:MAG TPA: ester cyclase [Nocardioidaceae bacterium]|nr:ester cyclase [Nocardioidaceae bacterium]